MKINVNDRSVNYEESGAGPAILVLQDGPSNREIGQLFAPLAEAGYRVIVTNLDGLVRGKLPAVDLLACSRTAVALLNHLGVGRAVTFGIGRGAMVLLEILASFPRRVAAASLVLGPLTAKQIQLADRRAIETAMRDRRFQGLKEELLAAIPAATTEQATRLPLSQLKRWISRVRSRNLYVSTISHCPSLLAEMEIPRLILESEQGGISAIRPRKCQEVT
jgi:pimeloyl-ACP methyl ester carboxylesterase